MHRGLFEGYVRVPQETNGTNLVELREIKKRNFKVYYFYMGELKWFIYAFVGLWILWLITGGPTRYENRNRPFLEQPAPIEGGRPYTIEDLQRR